MKVLVTGSAGFIGSAVTSRLLERGDTVIGADNHNDYYCTSLKEARILTNISKKNYLHHRIELSNQKDVESLFSSFRPSHVVHLAAQAGVRYSISNPHNYIQSNLVAFCNILEESKKNSVEHLVYGSSSSVYGANTSLPFSISDNVNHPLSLYAATKRGNELMAHAYSSLFQLPTTGLRFFTVYGPWGRPDMALFKFTEAIINGKQIQLYNNGIHSRDFTYIDDIVEGILRVLDKPAIKNSSWNSENPDPGTSSSPWRIYNLGGGNPVPLLDVLQIIEKALGKKSNIELLPLQLGDVANTFAEMSNFASEFNFEPKFLLEEGIFNFIDWYKSYYS